MNNKWKIALGILAVCGLAFAAAQTKFYGDILMQAHRITGLTMKATDPTTAATKGYVDTNKLSVAGGTLSGALNMSGQKVTGLGTPTASTDATSKGYVDALVAGSPTTYDSFLFYTLVGSVTNVARIFDVNSTGGYVRVSMLADNAGGTQSTITTAVSEESDTATVVRNETTMKAGSGFKVWLQSASTSDHYTSVRVRDAGEGGSVFLARVKYIDLSEPDWALYVDCSVSPTNTFSYKYTGERMYDIRKAFYNGMFLFDIGVSNVIGSSITCGLNVTAQGFTTPIPYTVNYVDGTTFTVPPHSCQYKKIYIIGYDPTRGLSLTIELANGVLGTIRTYRTYWSLDQEL